GRAGEIAPRVAARVAVSLGARIAPLDPALCGRAALIVSNPPYLTEDEFRDLPPEVRLEPYEALVGGTDVHARIAEDAWRWLRPGGWLVLEIGETQRDEVRALLAA